MSHKAVVIVQARFGSSRLPGKVLQELSGRTVLSRVLERCAAIREIDAICCAVPAGPADDPVAEEAARCGAIVVRGSEKDVLNRYFVAAVHLNADVIVRVTSDCPLLDPGIATDVLRLVTLQGADYSCNNLPPTWPHGLDCEAFRFEWLARANHEAVLPSEREHVTPFIRNHPQVRKLLLAGPGENCARHRWTLDTPQDLNFLRALFERMAEGPETFSYRYPLEILQREPDLANVNSSQDRDAGWKKSLAEDAAFLHQ